MAMVEGPIYVWLRYILQIEATIPAPEKSDMSVVSELEKLGKMLAEQNVRLG